MKFETTLGVARILRIGHNTLLRWVAQGKIRAPRVEIIGKQRIRRWKPADIERVRRYKEKFYVAGKGRKPHARK